MEQAQTVVGYKLSAPPASLKAWCDKWNKVSFKNGVKKTKLVAKSVARPNGATAYHLTLLRIACAPIVYSFRGLPLEEITDDLLRSVTQGLMDQAEIKAVFKF
jgi:hypothetical protein